MNDIYPFLHDKSSYKFTKSYFSHLGRVSPYRFATPNPLTSEHLEIVGQRAANIIFDKITSSSVSIIAIASRGIPLGTATLFHLASYKNMECFLSHTSCQGSLEHAYLESNTKYTVLMDNAINSGKTIINVIDKLKRHQIVPDLIIRLFDRQEFDKFGGNTTTFEKLVGCPIASIFYLSDLIGSLERDEERSEIIQYALNYGTNEIKEYIHKNFTYNCNRL